MNAIVDAFKSPGIIGMLLYCHINDARSSWAPSAGRCASRYQSSVEQPRRFSESRIDLEVT